MQLTIVGGGGFRTPLVYRALADDPDRIIDRVVLVDSDASRLRVITRVLEAMAGSRTSAPQVRSTTQLSEGLRGADFVFAAIRPGGVQGRERDENIPLRYGVLGQETVGIGGILYALRSIPAMREIAASVADIAPEAWLVNFTNPAGMVTEALQPILPGRVLGICDSPTALVRRVCRALAVSEDAATYDYIGLNHLGWLRSVAVDGVDLLPGLLADDSALTGFEEGQLFGPDLLRASGTIPNEYLHYFYYAADVLASVRRTTSRATQVAEQQREFYAHAAESAHPLAVWQSSLDARNRTYMATSREAAGAGERDPDDVEGGGYEQVALAVMSSLATGTRRRIILGVPNQSAIAGFDNGAVVEIPCVVGKNGAAPLSLAPPTAHQAGLMHQIKAVERATISAAVDGDRDALHFAIGTHPLNGSYSAAAEAVTECMSNFPATAARFGYRC